MRSIRRSLGLAGSPATEPPADTPAANTTTAPSAGPLMARSRHRMGDSAPRQSAPIDPQRQVDALLEARNGREPIEADGPLAALLRRPSSAALVQCLHADAQIAALSPNPTLVERLARQPRWVALLERSPAIVGELVAHRKLFKAVLQDGDALAEMIDEPLFRERLDVLQRAATLHKRLGTLSDPAFMESHRQAQASWTSSLLGRPVDEKAPIEKTISLVDLGHAACFATGCPRDRGESLQNFLTVAARQEAVIVCLMHPRDFERNASHGLVDYFARGEHEASGIRWSARRTPNGLPPEWTKPLDAEDRPRLTRHELGIQLPGEDRIRTATVLHFRDWHDGGVAEPHKLAQLLDRVDVELAERALRAGPAANDLPGLMAHCFYGVERTSVFCAMHALRQADKAHAPDLGGQLEQATHRLAMAREQHGLRPFTDLRQLAMVVDYAKSLEAARPRT